MAKRKITRRTLLASAAASASDWPQKIRAKLPTPARSLVHAATTLLFSNDSSSDSVPYGRVKRQNSGEKSVVC